MTEVLIVYYSKSGSTAALAKQAARGVEEVAGCLARIRQIPPVFSALQLKDLGTQQCLPESGPPYVTEEDMQVCKGLLVGSPVHFGMLASSVKHFFDQTTRAWISGTLENKPAGVFTSSSTLHGGQEMTLMSMIVPLLHHGCVIVGVPYSEKALEKTSSGGTPYGASHVSKENKIKPDTLEAIIAKNLGKRIAQWTLRNDSE